MSSHYSKMKWVKYAFLHHVMTFNFGRLFSTLFSRMPPWELNAVCHCFIVTCLYLQHLALHLTSVCETCHTHYCLGLSVRCKFLQNCLRTQDRTGKWGMCANLTAVRPMTSTNLFSIYRILNFTSSPFSFYACQSIILHLTLSIPYAINSVSWNRISINSGAQKMKYRHFPLSNTCTTYMYGIYKDNNPSVCRNSRQISMNLDSALKNQVARSTATILNSTSSYFSFKQINQ